MPTQKIDDYYEETRDPERKKDILQVVKNTNTKKLFLAWSYMEVEEFEEEDTGDLWDGYSVDVERWLSLAGLPPATAHIKKCHNLMSMNLVFPDGRIHHWIHKYLKKTGAANLGGASSSGDDEEEE